MKKRVLSALLVLCMACSMVSTVWANQATPETADKPASVLLDDSQSAPVTNAPAQDQDVAEGLTAPEDEESGQQSDVDTPDASQPEQAESTGTPVGGGVEYTAALEQDDQVLNVIVTAPEGAFDEGMEPKLSVSAIEDEAQTDGIAAKLDEYGLTYDGFAALDISFKNEAGEEIEPKVPVTVRIELPKAIVDSGIDLNTLAVQHLEEDADGNVQNVTEVATLDNGITLSEEAAAAANEAAGVAPMSDLPTEEATAGDAAEIPAAVAEFDVDGFSDFVITWNYYFSVTVHYVDEGGNDIQGTHEDKVKISSSYNNSINFVDYAGTIDGYTYREARYINANGKVVTRMVAEESEKNNNKKRTLTFYNGDKEVDELEYSYSTKSANIYLVYKAEDTTEPGGDQGDTGTVTEDAKITVGKTADLREDGNYNLTLSISGDRGSITNPKAVDVLFVVDKSGSMEFGLNKHHYDHDQEVAPGKHSGDIQRIAGVQQAVAQITNNLSANENLDVRYALVTFSGDASASYHGYGPYGYYELNDDVYDDAEVANGWTDSKTAIQDTVNGIEPVGGTNYEAGLSEAKDLLAQDTGRGALRVVIFLSDGDPSYYYSAEGTKTYTDTMAKIGQNYYTIDARSTAAGHTVGSGSGHDERAMEAAKAVCQDFKPNYFYCVAVGPEAGEDGTIYNHLKELENAVDVPAANSDTYSGDNTDDLLSAFNSIQQEITFFAATDVTITDPLSQYADIVLNADGAAKFTVTVTRTELKDEEGKVTSEAKTWEEKVTAGEEVKFQDRAGNDVTVTPAYDADTKTITLTFPHSTGDTPGYELEPGYTYSISTVITPSETAKNLGMNNGAAKQTPDTGTGTHADAGQQGFWSNDNANAKVTFTANGAEGSELFPKPVIQVDETYTPEPVDPNPDIRKYVDDNPDGTYDLSLDVTGTAIKEQTKLNVLYVLDESYSMMWEMDGSFPYSDISSSSNNNGFGPNPGGDNQYTEKNNKGVEAGLEIPYTYRRYLAAVNAIKQLNSTLAQNDDVLDVQYALVEFADKTYETSRWSQSSNFSLPEAKWETFESGTNYVAAFTSANEALNNLNEDRRGAETVVVFITDGDPNRDTVDGSGSADAEEGISAANKVLKQMPDFVDSLYVIGVSDDVNPTNLQNLIKGIDVEANVFTTSQANLLVQQFAQMAAEIAGTQTKNAVITDTLSEYAELVNENAAPSITIKKKDGSTAVDVTAPDTLTEVRDGQGELTGYTGTYTFTDNSETVELTYTYSLANKTLTLAFPEEYSLTKDWVYTVTVNIQPSETAVNYQSGEGEPKYPDTGDANTDVPGATGNEIISSRKPGFHSNTEATLTYNDDGEKEYPNPVIQVRNGSLTIYKNITSNEPGFKVADLGNVEFRFEVQGPDDVKNKTYGTIDFDEQGVAEVTIEKNGELTIEGLPAGEYTVTEISKPDSEDGSYYCSGMTYQVGTGNEENQPQAATVSAGATTTVTIENTYAKYRTVIVTKQVGGDMGDTTAPFNFTTTVERNGNTATIGGKVIAAAESDFAFGQGQGAEKVHAKLQEKENDDTAVFTDAGYTLASGETVTITKLKEGDTITIEETDFGKNGYETSYAVNGTTQSGQEKSVTIGDEHFAGNNTVTVTVTNNRQVVAPTGLESNHTTPYVLMITAAGMAGLALIGGIVARRIRRRRQE